MRRTLLLLFGAWIPMAGQTAVDPVLYPTIRLQFEPQDDEQRLRCDVRPLRPTLGFSFRFQAGYFVRVPMNQFFGSGHRWLIVARVTPEGGKETSLYLGERISLPDVPKTNIALEAGGMFLIGIGRYRVDVVLQDETGRACRAAWWTEAKLRKEERSVIMAIPPHTAQALTFRTWAPSEPNSDSRAQRLTILLHAAPLFPRATKLRSYDRGLLLSSLVSLLDPLHPRAVRLVVFNLDQQKEIYRSDRFQPDDLVRVSNAMNSLNLATVDHRVLQNRKGHVDVVADLVNQELRAKDASDAVIFLGPAARYSDKVPESKLEERTNDAPRFFYFQYKPYWSRGADFLDSIGSAVKKVKGRIVVIRSPGEFAKAIDQVEEHSTTGLVVPSASSLTGSEPVHR